jgi:enoyl-CoA hydratase/carnithine racemase
MTRRPLQLARKGPIATITLANSAGGNRIDETVAQEIREAAETVAAAPDVAVVVVGARGADFCRGGADDRATRVDWAGALAAIPQPVIAVLQGEVADEGAELALIADIRLCARTARFRFGQVATGRLPSSGATQRLPRVVGRMRALDLLLSGRWVRALEAVRIGLVAEVVADSRLKRRAGALAHDLAKKGPVALRYVKEAVGAGLELTLAQGIRLEQDLYVLLQTTEDRGEGVRAFLEKRRPRYRGR